MAKQLFVVRPYGGGWANMPTVGGLSVFPCLTLDPGKPESEEHRVRPGLESGCGPYFHSYAGYPNGVERMWSDGHFGYSDRMSYYERDTTSPNDWYPLTVKRTFSNGTYLWEYQYAYSFWYKPWKWREHADGYIYRWAGPASETDSSLYPKCMVLAQSWSQEHVWDRKPSRPYFENAFWERFEKFIALFLGRDVEEEGGWVDMTNMARASNLVFTPIPRPTFCWKFGERTAFEWWRITESLPPLYQSLANTAYVEAVDSIPDSGCNSIATVLEIAGSMKDLLRGKINTVKSLGDVWLQYRYVITTNKADIEAYCELTRRLTNLANQSVITLRGTASMGGVSCSCSCEVDVSSALPKDTAEWLSKYGFKLSAVNVWDMVPYSFVVDWFLHVGDILESLEKMGNALSVQVSNCWFSFRSNYQGQDTYFRVPGRYAAAFPYVTYKPASGKTTIKRILDAVVLFG